MLRHVAFDGSIETAGHVLAACALVDSRVWVVVDRRATAEQIAWLQTVHDCCGSLAHVEGRRVVCHWHVGSARSVKAFACPDGVESFMKHTSDRYDRIDDVAAAVAPLRWCPTGHCGVCSQCKRVERAADAYGLYELLDE